jgi:signal transduction histidine kinase
MRAFASCSFLKSGFLDGNPVGTLLTVHAAELAGLVAAAAAAGVLLRFALLRRRAVPAGVARLAEAIPDALGDALLAIDPAGRIQFANSAAGRLAGVSVAELIDRDVAGISPDLAAMARGLERSPATARIVVAGAAGPVRARVALVRVSSRPPLAYAVLRPLPRPSPPPLPRAPPPPWSERGEARAGLAAAADALREPVADALEALSLLRLAAPPLAAGAGAALASAEAALEVAARRVAALDVAGRSGVSRRSLDLAALVEDLVATFPAPAGVRVRFASGAARALGEDRTLRAALRELLGAAAAALPSGGEIVIGVQGGRAGAIVEIEAPAPVPAGGLAIARALVAPQGGRVDEEPVPGRGSIVRIALERAAALERA